jgi:Protein of unknown function (DUF3168)
MPATSPSLALQTAVFAALTANAALTARLGGPRIHDHVPPSAPTPYVTFGQSIERDWSTGSEEGREHTLTLNVWSRSPGRRETHEIAALVRAALHNAALVLTGHRLVNLRHELTESRRDPDGETFQAILRFRATTEPL